MAAIFYRPLCVNWMISECKTAVTIQYKVSARGIYFILHINIYILENFPVYVIVCRLMSEWLNLNSTSTEESQEISMMNFRFNTGNNPFLNPWTGSSLVQVMACHLFSAKPQPKQIMIYCQLDPKEQTSAKSESKFEHFLSQKCI